MRNAPRSWVWLAILAASFAVNLLLGMRLQQAFADLQDLRIFPLGHAKVSVEAATPDARRTFALYGDSRALMWDTRGLRHDFRVVNLARGGATSSQLALQLGTASVVTSDWSLVEVGVNDLHPLGVLPEQEGVIRAQLKANLLIIARQLRERSRCVVFLTIPPPGPVPLSRRWLWSDRTVEALDEANGWIRELARSPGVRVIDAYALLANDRKQLAETYRVADSFLHLNGAAYDVLNRDLAQILVNSDGPAGTVPAETASPGRQPSASSPCGSGIEG